MIRDSNSRDAEAMKKRITSLAGRIAHLQSIKYMYDSLSNVTGLVKVIDRLAMLLIDIHGGSLAIIYYRVNNKWYQRGMSGKTVEADVEKDRLLAQAINTGENIVINSMDDDSCYIGVRHTDIVFINSYFPLVVSGKVIGVVRLENMGVPKNMVEELKTFFQYAALLLSNEIRSLVKIEEAYNELEQIFNASPTGMLVVNNSNSVIRVNRAMLELIGETPEKIIGKKYTEIFSSPGSDECDSIFDMLDSTGTGIEYDTVFPGKSGEDIHCIINVSRLKVRDCPVGAIMSVKDITDRKIAEIKLRESLAEKEILLKEVHHRVKNNLQIISSLITLQDSYIKDENISVRLLDLNNRINSMAVIHEKLYSTSEFSKINFSDYLNTIVNNLVLSYQTDVNRIRVHVHVENICLDLNTAIPCGLLVNEIISNSLKYAFPDGMEGDIRIGMKETGGGRCILEIEDNGKGLDDDVSLESNHGLGMELISVLVKQLKGDLHLRRENGTGYAIEMPL